MGLFSFMAEVFALLVVGTARVVKPPYPLAEPTKATRAVLDLMVPACALMAARDVLTPERAWNDAVHRHVTRVLRASGNGDVWVLSDFPKRKREEQMKAAESRARAERADRAAAKRAKVEALENCDPDEESKILPYEPNWQPEFEASIDPARLKRSLGHPAGQNWWRWIEQRVVSEYGAHERYEVHCSLVERPGRVYGEADLETALLLRETPDGTEFHVYSNDSDAFVILVLCIWDNPARCRVVWHPGYRAGKPEEPVDLTEYTLHLQDIGWNWPSYLAACILGGTDFCSRERGHCINNVGAKPFWTAALTLRTRDYNFPERNAWESYLGDILGALLGTERVALTAADIQAEYSRHRHLPRLRLPGLPRDLHEAHRAFERNWNYWYDCTRGRVVRHG